MINIENISKSYDGVLALDNISLNVKPGELFGILGPDGAGKTTLIRILATLIKADSGTGTLAGLDLVKDYRKIRTIVGYMPGRFSLYQDLTVRENLEFFANVFGTTIQQSYDLIRDIYVQIEPFNERRAGALSGGMKQKLALCCAMIHLPKVLLLDEPGTGVDPVSRKEFWDMLKHLRSTGITIFVSTANMDEAEKCDRVVLLQKGKLLASGTPSEITAAYPHPLYAVRANDMYRLINDLRTLDQAAGCYAFGEYAHLSMLSDNLNTKDIQHFLERKGHEDVEVLPTTANIEDCFIELM
ncbi:MAG: ABC transporter ATP-binding protein [Lewinellaceae bacterium]|nr:ABC transporter ATP-binding protein [Lewinellaceae bacterium]